METNNHYKERKTSEITLSKIDKLLIHVFLNTSENPVLYEQAFHIDNLILYRYFGVGSDFNVSNLMGCELIKEIKNKNAPRLFKWNSKIISDESVRELTLIYYKFVTNKIREYNKKLKETKQSNNGQQKLDLKENDESINENSQNIVYSEDNFHPKSVKTHKNLLKMCEYIYNETKDKISGVLKEDIDPPIRKNNNEKKALSQKFNIGAEYKVDLFIEHNLMEEKFFNGKPRVKWIGPKPTKEILLPIWKKISDYKKEHKKRKNQNSSPSEKETVTQNTKNNEEESYTEQNIEQKTLELKDDFKLNTPEKIDEYINSQEFILKEILITIKDINNKSTYSQESIQSINALKETINKFIKLFEIFINYLYTVEEIKRKK